MGVVKCRQNEAAVLCDTDTLVCIGHGDLMLPQLRLRSILPPVNDYRGSIRVTVNFVIVRFTIDADLAGIEISGTIVDRGFFRWEIVALCRREANAAVILTALFEYRAVFLIRCTVAVHDASKADTLPVFSAIFKRLIGSELQMRCCRSRIGIVVLQIKPTAGAFGLPLISQVRAVRTDHNIIGSATIDSRVIRNGINCNGGCACRQR